MKVLFAVLLALLSEATPAAPVDVNMASQAQLESLKGIGPALAGQILQERQKGPFKDWPDLISRVKGIGPASAARYSAAGLTVGGARLEHGASVESAAPPAATPRASP